jgi:hypothetical protein
LRTFLKAVDAVQIAIVSGRYKEHPAPLHEFDISVVGIDEGSSFIIIGREEIAPLQ